MVLTSQMKKKSGGMELGVKNHAHHMHSITKASNHLYAYNILKEATKNSRNKDDIIKNDVIKSDVIRNDVIRNGVIRHDDIGHGVIKNETKDDIRNSVVENDGIRNDVVTTNREEILCIKPVEIDSKQFITEAYSRLPTSPSLKSPPIDKSVVSSTSPLLRKPSPKSLSSSRTISPRNISPRNISPENILLRKKTPDSTPHEVSSLRESPPSSVREVINIDSRNIDTSTNSDFDYRKNIINGFKKAKRKKGSIDEILQQVEAKKRKEESKQSVLKTTINHFDDKVGEKRIPEIIPPSDSKTENDKDMIKSVRRSPPIISLNNKTSLSSPPTLSSPPKPKTEIYLKKESHYDAIPPSKEKLFFIQNPKYVRPIAPLLNNERHNYRNEIVDYRLQPNKKNSAFHQVRKEYKFVPYTRESQQQVYYPSVTTPSPKISSTRDINNNDPSLSTSEQSKNDNSMKNENFTRKKKKLPPNERYSNLTSSQLQRRLVANARERSRVHALSNAFDTLRSAIPSYSPEQKISKLTILRVAINYINALQEILASDPMHIYENRAFVGHVNECSCVLQTEYGRSKVRLAID